ncbi:MAG: ATP-binding cassette domain-containing protein [bacterium]|nr:ATP-binding cassette domain-containing protein [bacterium]
MTERSIMVSMQHVHKRFGPKHVLFDVNLRFERGGFVSLVGPSGCGKSTLLYMILGTLKPTAGVVLVGGALVQGLSRNRGIVYQHYSLFPHLTVLENVAFGRMLDATSIPFRVLRPFAWRALRKRHLDEARDLLTHVGLGDPQTLQCYPHQLSGGMRQRVAIAQAMIMKPSVLLLDEPFGALDQATRESLQRMILQLHADNERARAEGRQDDIVTVVLVTHEIDEAILLADKVVGVSQYWNWREQGYDRCPGATVVYSKPAPIFKPDHEAQHSAFVEQRQEIIRAAMDETVLQPPEMYRTFWKGDAPTARGAA